MIINQEFKKLIPSLSEDEFDQLETSIIAEGCRDSLITWNGTLVDGHNRYEICLKHDLPFKTIEKEFSDDTEAKEWIMRNQLGRRNLSDVERGRIALKLKDSIAERARHNQLSKLKQNTVCPILDKRETIIDTKKELAKLAGISHGTLAKIEKVDNTAPEVIKENMGKGISINKAYEMAKNIIQFPATRRVAEAERMVAEEIKESPIEFEELKREELRKQNISKKLENMIYGIATNATLITEEYVGYILRGSKTAVDWIESVDFAIENLEEFKEILKIKNSIRRIK